MGNMIKAVQEKCKAVWDKVVVAFNWTYNGLLDLYTKYSILLICAVVGLGITGGLADLFVVGKVIGIISAFLIVTSIALDDRDGKGLFPSYDEEKLIKLAKKDPIASAMVVLGKNALMAVILILAVLFVRP